MVADRAEIVAARHRLLVAQLLEREVEEPQARGNGPVVRDLVGEVGTEHDALDRRLARVPVHGPVLPVMRPQTEFGRDGEAEREVPRKRLDDVRVRQKEESRVHLRGAAAVDRHVGRRMLGDETHGNDRVREVRHRRRVVEHGGRVHGLAHHGAAHRGRGRARLIEREARARSRESAHGSTKHTKRERTLFHGRDLFLVEVL